MKDYNNCSLPCAKCWRLKEALYKEPEVATIPPTPDDFPEPPEDDPPRSA